MDSKLEALEQAIETAEAEKRAFVKENPNGTGDKAERIRLYNQVESARKALRDYKRANPHLL
jgi:protein subunit release factor A